MAEDVEVMSVNDGVDDDPVTASDVPAGGAVIRHVLSNNSDISSSNSASQPNQAAASTEDAGAPDQVSSITDSFMDSGSDRDQHCDCSSSGQPATRVNEEMASTSQGQYLANESGPGMRYRQVDPSDTICCPSDTESEIIVDDSPASVHHVVDRIESSNDNGAEECIDLLGRDCDNTSSHYMRPLGRSRSVTPSPSYIRLATPSTPGTPRLRSGSVSGTTYAPPSPRPSTRGTPSERPRAGSMGEIEMKERAQGRVKIIDGLDILQLPRPRNPGGILPINGLDSYNGSNEALNLTVDDRQRTSKPLDRLTPVTRTFTSFQSLDSTAASSSKQSNMSYMISNIIRTTPTRQKPTASSFSSNLSQRTAGCAINETVERPKPSSIVDSEGVAKKIARLNSGGFMCATSNGNLWDRESSNLTNSHLSNIRVLSDKTPPERPKPPRRPVLSPADNSDLTSDRYVSSSVRRRLSPSQLHANNPDTNGADVDACQTQYKCRLCTFSSTSYNNLQLHTSKHGGGNKTFKCAICDYSTNERTNFRRHRRLHQKASPVSMLKCVRCSFSTSLSRKLREHYQQVHPDLPASTLIPGLGADSLSPPPFLASSNGISADMTGSYYYDNALLMNRTDRLGFPYGVTGRHPHVNMPFDHYSVPYGGLHRDRHGENLAPGYLRSSFPSGVHTEPTNRQAATSTVTSSSYLLHSGADNSLTDIHTCNNQNSDRCPMPSSRIKIKVETDMDNSSDVSSCNHATPDLNDSAGNETGDIIMASSSRLDPGHIVRRHRSDEGLGTNGSILDIPTDLTSPRKQGTATSDNNHISSGINIDGGDNENGNMINASSISDTVIKADSTARGVQCVLPIIKTEINLDGDFYDYYHRPIFAGVERAVQCEITSSSSSSSTAAATTTAANFRSQALPNGRMIYRSQSASESDQSEPHSVNMESRCEHCGINFEDEVIFSIHIGCHSHTDPFKCNVCGKQCGNKYGFYSHIMRGHQC